MHTTPNVGDEGLKNGWVVFELPPGTPPLTSETLEEWEGADQEEEYRRAFSLRR